MKQAWDEIKRLEEISLNGWPAMQTLLYDGWLIRISEGFSKRSNSVNPLYGHTMDLDEKINDCEQFFEERGLPVVFKITSFSEPNELDSRLEELGYAKAEHVLVKTLGLSEPNLNAASKAELGGPSNVIGGEAAAEKQGTDADSEVVFEETLPEAWLTGISALKGLSTSQIASKRKLLTGQPLKQCFATMKRGGQPVAYGTVALEAGWAGLSDIVTDPVFRGKGYGRFLTERLLFWAAKQGAHSAYLLVVRDNAPAISLYDKLGFVDRYDYWYRVKP